MILKKEQLGDATVVTVGTSSVEYGNCKEFREKITPMIEDSQRVILDFGGVDYVGSPGLAAILSCYREMTQKGGELRICNLTRSVACAFELVQLNKIIPIYDTRGAACEAMGLNAA